MIVVEAVSKRLHRRLALDDITFTVAPGEILALVGPGGAGKTTALRILATLLRPDSGTATVAGVSVDGDPRAARRLIGYLPSHFTGYDRLTAGELVEFYAGVHDMARSRRRRLAGELLDVLGLGDRVADDVETLDRGEKRRLGLAGALVHDPPALVLDEPLTGVDAEAKDQIRELVRALSRVGKAVVVTSRSGADVEPMADRTGLLDHGRLMTSADDRQGNRVPS